MINVCIVGATGYTGGELVKILIKHPKVKISSLYAKLDKQPVYIDDEFPSLKGKTHLPCYNFNPAKIPAGAEVAFLAVPHTVAMDLAPLFIQKRIKVIDLSADFRLRDTRVYQNWYHKKHNQPHLLKQAVYGLPELNSSRIRKANLIANPGCFPTGTILGVVPVIGNTTGSILVNATTGTSGAGKKASLALLFSECSDNMRPYKVFQHQHQPEIEQELSAVAGKKITVRFVPALAPLTRGILTTIFMKLNKTITPSNIIKQYRKFYRKSPFVTVLPYGSFPQLKDILKTNNCHIGLKMAGKDLVVVTAIDNLQKGAAGQAVENMNIMFGLPREMGLT